MLRDALNGDTVNSSQPLAVTRTGAVGMGTAASALLASTQPAGDTLGSVVARVARGDQDALEELYAATSRSVLAIVLRVVQCRTEAEDIVQDVYLEVWRTAARFDASRGSVNAWLKVMAHHRAVDRVRAAQRTADRDLRYAQNFDRTTLPDTEEQVLARQESQRVREALAVLPATQRAPLLLAYFGGHTRREIADILQVSPDAVKARMSVGVRGLRTSLGPREPIADPADCGRRHL